MTKYKLKIPDMTPSKDADMVSRLNMFRSVTIEDMKAIESEFERSIPKSWMEEVKDDDFDTFWSDCGLALGMTKDCHCITWHSAQKKRDELYKPLISFLESFPCVNKAMRIDLDLQLSKLKEALKK
jgi:hypothetical protein